MVLTLFVLTLTVFYTSSFFSPLERAAMFVSRFDVDPQQVNLAELAESLHLSSDPFYVQYLDWLRLSLFTGKLGYSRHFYGFVFDVILRYFPPTIELVMFSAPIVIFGGIKIGTYSAKRAYQKRGREDLPDSTIRAFTTLAYSMPLFFTGLLSLSIFFLNLRWFAPERVGSAAGNFITLGSWNSYTGMYTIDALLNGQLWIFFDALRHLVLPVATLTIAMLPVVVKITRSSMLGEYNRSYVMVARAKGLKEVEVVSRVKRNAMISILTVTSILFGNMLTGIVVTEHVFAWGGLGTLSINAVKYSDFALMAGLSVVFCFIFVTINLLVDVIYTYIDPRIKL